MNIDFMIKVWAAQEGLTLCKAYNVTADAICYILVAEDRTVATMTICELDQLRYKIELARSRFTNALTHLRWKQEIKLRDLLTNENTPGSAD